MPQSSSTAGPLDGRTALITGAARGIGHAIAQALASAGARVALTDIDADGARLAAEAIPGASLGLGHDVTSETAWAEVLETTQAALGPLRILVNNAGTGRPGTPESHSWKHWQLVMTVNAGGTFLGCRAAIPAMRAAGGGVIVNIASCYADRASPELTAYGASKAAVTQLTRSVAVHCARAGDPVRCVSVHPGPVLTPMLERAIADAPDPADARAAWLRGVPTGRFADPAEVGGLVAWLCTDAAAYATGSAFTLDGGMTAI